MSKCLKLCLAVLALVFFTTQGHAALTLQELINQTAEGETLVPPPGVYNEHIKLTKPIKIDGQGKVIVDAGGEGTVMLIETDGATITGMTFQNSGVLHNDVDAGIHVRGKYNVVRNNLVLDCLFGIDLSQSNNNIIKNNTFTSKERDLGLRGDAVRLWYSFENEITDNKISNSRDFVVWYSANNVIARNDIRNGRYGIHFMYAKYNRVEDNNIHKNTVGIFLMYSDDVVIRNNKIYHALGAAGMGIGMKESSNIDVVDNEILYSSIGLYSDLSPYQPETTNRVYRNTFAFNRVGINFLSDWTGSLVKENVFRDNIRQVSVANFASAARNEWEGNYWDDYEGFDLDKDGIGDKPYSPKVFADRIWMDVPDAAFFLGTPLLSLVDFLERLAPFTEPLIMLKDSKPQFSPEFEHKTTRKTGQIADEDAGTSRYDPFGLSNPNVGTAK
ncbi:nitrous oxide reductase family maturation protein NosD [Terasakiella sp. A23]|uniref:nitrous oxide reductase family maturation protein NosD n=1 Tax=Terasakiella sp. FCG-A23 TaxID=3080561 RepID=UPI0029542079|nr:nitrous oxide reductase family maturation protein NosD [Terasakiella sp. A23]MDV7341063.1 nitrous oxide reductase family maturation protein NosD [Terasakiella sp. A23]